MMAVPGSLFGQARSALGLAFERNMLPVCAACSVALHSVLLVVHVAPEPALQATRSGTSSQRTVQVRLQLSPSAGDVGVMRQQDAAQPTARSAIPVQPRHEEADATDGLEEVVQLPLTTVERESGSSTRLSTSVFAQHDEFVPRPLLSVPPTARTPIIFSSQPDETDIARYRGVLSLFIDEEGRVQYIAADGPLLPPALEQAAREAFMQAQFWPGQVDGHAVKSRQRVEVMFDNTPLSVH